MEDSFKEKIRLAKSFNQNTVIRNGKGNWEGYLRILG